MTILVDTNIILDIFLQREPYAGEAREIMTKCAEREVIGYLHSEKKLFPERETWAYKKFV